MPTPYQVGETLTADDVNYMLEAARAFNDIKDELDPEETIIIPVVPAPPKCKWNQRVAEIAIDSFTYHRIVSQEGEQAARNSLMPVSSPYFTMKGELSASLNVPGKTIGGIALDYAGYPAVTDNQHYVTDNGKLTFLTGNPNATVDSYFESGSPRQGFTNGHKYDRYTPGKLVYVYPSKAGYFVTSTSPGGSSFPCIIRQGPVSTAWFYNTLTYKESSADVKKATLQAQLDAFKSKYGALNLSALLEAEKAYKNSEADDEEGKLEAAVTAFFRTASDIQSSNFATIGNEVKSYIAALHAEYPDRVYRYSNRQEFLVTIARGLLKNVVGIDFDTTYSGHSAGTDSEADTTNTVVAKMDDGECSQEAIYNKIYNTHAWTEGAGDTREDDIKSWVSVMMNNAYTGDHEFSDDDFKWDGEKMNANYAASLIFEATKIIGNWLSRAYDGDGQRVPCDLNSIQGNAENLLGFIVNGTYALRQGLSVFIIVQPLVPGKKYNLYVDPIITKSSSGDGVMDGSAALIWDSNRLVPYEEISDENAEELEREVDEQNVIVRSYNNVIREKNQEHDRKFAEESKIEVKPTKPSFRVTKRTGVGSNRASQAATTLNAVANALSSSTLSGTESRTVDIIMSPSSRRPHYEQCPWDSAVSEETTMSFVEVSPKIEQADWLRYLYSSKEHSLDLSKNRIYALFGGHDYVPLRNTSHLAVFLNKLNETAKHLNFVEYEGVLNTQTGQFWCSETKEVLGNWYNLKTKRAAKMPCRTKVDGVNVVCTHRLDSVQTREFITTEPYENDNGETLGAVIVIKPPMLFDDDGNEVVFNGIGTFNPAGGSVSVEIYTKNAESDDDKQSTEIPQTKTITSEPGASGSGDTSGGSGGSGGDTVSGMEYQPIDKVVDPSMSADMELAEVVYQPDQPEVTTTTTVVETPATTGIVRLPIIPLPLRKKDTPPRVNAPLTRDGDTIFDGATYPRLNDKDKAIAYSFLVAKSAGLVELTGTKPQYRLAYYSSTDDTWIPFWKVIDRVVDAYNREITLQGYKAVLAGEVVGVGQTTGSQLQGGVEEYSAGGFKIKFANRILLPSPPSSTYLGKVIFMGRYVPKEKKNHQIFYNLATKTGEVYIQTIDVKCKQTSKTGVSDYVWGDEAFPSYHPYEFLPTTGDDPEYDQLISKSMNTTAGWVQYAYYDEIQNQKAKMVRPEMFTLSPPPIWSDMYRVKGVSKDSWIYESLYDGSEVKINPVMITPFASYSKTDDVYGFATTASIDKETHIATIAYDPLRNSNGVRNNATYDQLKSFPFDVEGLVLPGRTMLTTKKYKAQRKDWYPAICRNLDQNEVLIPGTLLTSVSKCTVPLYVKNDAYDPEHDDEKNKWKTIDFVYYEVEPPEKYTSTMEGTPYTNIIRFTKDEPDAKESDDHIIEDDDVWLTDIRRVSKYPLHEAGGNECYVGVSLTQDGTPRMRQPYGIFNDCENTSNLGMFIKRTNLGKSFACTARIDYVPYGYAVPTKTPSCYYKTSGDSCAVKMMTVKYTLQRMSEANETQSLQLVGACYVPCSALTDLG